MTDVIFDKSPAVIYSVYLLFDTIQPFVFLDAPNKEYCSLLVMISKSTNFDVMDLSSTLKK